MRKNVPFLSLWLNQSFFECGDSLYILAMITLLYTKTQSALFAALFPFIRAITSVASGMVAPLVMERGPLRWFLSVTQVLHLFLFLGLLLIIEYAIVHFFVLLFFLVLLSFLAGWISPARNALLPRIVAKKDLVRANGMVSTTDQIALLIGFSLGGLALTEMGTVPVLWICFVLFFFSALFSFFIKDPTQERMSIPRTPSWKGMKELWAFIYQHSIYRRLFVMDSMEFMAGAVWTGAITLVFVQEILHKDEAWWGFYNGSYLLGTTLGGFVALWMHRWIETRLKAAFIIGSAQLGILTIVFALSLHPIFTFILFFLMGIPYQVREVAMRTLLQMNTHHRQLPQVFAAHKMIGSVFYALGFIVWGWTTDVFGPQLAYLTSAVLVFGSVWIAVSLPERGS